MHAAIKAPFPIKLCNNPICGAHHAPALGFVVDFTVIGIRKAHQTIPFKIFAKHALLPVKGPFNLTIW